MCSVVNFGTADGSRQAIGFVGHDGDAGDALGGGLVGVLRHGVAALGGLPAGHRHGVVEQQFVGDGGAGGDRLAQGEQAVEWV